MSSLKLYERQQRRRESADGQANSASRGGAFAPQPSGRYQARSRVSDADSVVSNASSTYGYPESRFDAYGRETGIDTSFASASRLASLRGGPKDIQPRPTDASSFLSEASVSRAPLPVDTFGRERTSIGALSGVAPIRESPIAAPRSRSSLRAPDSYIRPSTATATSINTPTQRREPDDYSTTGVGRTSSLAAWSRAALEARVETLEKLLAEKEATPAESRRSIPAQVSDDRDLSEHLQVVVRKNRELRAELEVAKSKLATLLEEREAFALKLAHDNDSLQALLQEAQRAKDALGNCIKTLSAEKAELATKLALAEDEIHRLRANGGAIQPFVEFEEVRGNVEDVSIINEGLSESLKAMQLKNPNFSVGLPPSEAPQ